jgi:hypothetical protein
MMEGIICERRYLIGQEREALDSGMLFEDAPRGE